MSHIVFLGLARNQLDYINAAKRFGYKIIGIDVDSFAIGVDSCDIFIKSSINDYENIGKEIKKFNSIIGVISEQTDNGLLTLGYLNSLFSLNGPNYETVKNIRDKFKQRKIANSFQIKQPNFFSVNEFMLKSSDLLKSNKEFLIKPKSGQSSIGVMDLDTSKVGNIVDYLNNLSLSEDYLIEEKIEGSDYSIDGYIFQEIVNISLICKKEKYETNKFVDQLLFATSYDKKKDELLFGYVESIIQAFKLDNCLFHIEVKVKDNDYSLIELTCRGGGSGLSSILADMLHNGSFTDNRIRLIESKEIVHPKKIDNMEGCLLFFQSNKGTQASLEEIKKLSVNFIHEAIPGNSSEEIKDGRNRPEKVIFSYNSHDKKVAINLINKIK